MQENEDFNRPSAKDSYMSPPSLDDSVSGYSTILGNNDDLENPLAHRMLCQPFYNGGELRTEDCRKRELYEQMRDYRNSIQVLTNQTEIK